MPSLWKAEEQAAAIYRGSACAQETTPGSYFPILYLHGGKYELIQTCMKNGHNLEIMSLGTQDGMGLVTKSGETNEERKFKSREMLQSELDALGDPESLPDDDKGSRIRQLIGSIRKKIDKIITNEKYASFCLLTKKYFTFTNFQSGFRNFASVSHSAFRSAKIIPNIFCSKRVRRYKSNKMQTN